MNIWIKVILIGIAVIAVIMGLVFYFNRKVIAKGDEFFAFVAKKDITSAYNLFSPLAKEKVTIEQLNSIFDDFITADIILPVSWKGRSVENKSGETRGELNGVITLQDSTKLNTKIQLTKENGVWYINYFTLKPADAEQFTKSIQGIGEAFVRSVFAGEIQTAYDMLHPKLKATVSYDDFVSLEKAVQEIAKDTTYDSSTWVARQTTDEKGSVFVVMEGDMQFKNKTSHPVKFILRKDADDSDKWKITLVDFKLGESETASIKN